MIENLFKQSVCQSNRITLMKDPHSRVLTSRKLYAPGVMPMAESIKRWIKSWLSYKDWHSKMKMQIKIYFQLCTCKYRKMHKHYNAFLQFLLACRRSMGFASGLGLSFHNYRPAAYKWFNVGWAVKSIRETFIYSFIFHSFYAIKSSLEMLLGRVNQI